MDEIISAVDEMAEEKAQDYHPPQKRPKGHVKEKTREFKVVGDEPPRMQLKLNESTCPIEMKSVPKTDVQVSIYTCLLLVHYLYGNEGIIAGGGGGGVLVIMRREAYILQCMS